MMDIARTSIGRARPLAACALALAALGACSQQTAKTGPQPQPAARADIQGFLPNTVSGTAAFSKADTAGMRVRVDVNGLLPDREYAIHIHENGDCSSPAATGGHFDPGESDNHGLPGGSPGAHHAGDLPNLTTDGDGHGHLEFTTNAFGAESSSFSVIGHSIVIHANPDDFSTQPAGASGDKIACGIIRPPQ